MRSSRMLRRRLGATFDADYADSLIILPVKRAALSQREREFTRQLPESLTVPDRFRLGRYADTLCLNEGGQALIMPRATAMMLIAFGGR